MALLTGEPPTNRPPGSATGAARRAGCGCGCTGHPAAGGAERPPRDSDVRRRPDRVPLRPRGRRQPLLLLPDGTDLRRHTDHDDFYARHASTDGTRVVYQCAGDLWLVDDLDRTRCRASSTSRLGGPRAGRRPYQVPAAGACRLRLAVDATGRASAVVRTRQPVLADPPRRPGAHARRHPGRPGPAARDARRRPGGSPTSPTRRARTRSRSPPAAGERTGEPRRLGRGQLGRVQELAVAPGRRALAVATHDGRLLLVDTSAARPARSPNWSAPPTAPVRDLAFSPDSAWLAWSHPGIGTLAAPDQDAHGWRTGAVVDVTNGRFEDESRSSPATAATWRSCPGAASTRSTTCTPATCPSRSAAAPTWCRCPRPRRPRSRSSPEGRPRRAGSTRTASAGTASEGDGAVIVEVEGLTSRVDAVPGAPRPSTPPCNRSAAAGWSGCAGRSPARSARPSPTRAATAPAPPWNTSTSAKRQARPNWSSDLDWFAVSGDGTRLVVIDERRLRGRAGHRSRRRRRLDGLYRPAAHPARRSTRRPSGGRRTRRRAASCAAYFWEPRTCAASTGTAVLAQYRPLVERVATADEFADLLREVLGELGTSHAYVMPPPGATRARALPARIGLLGADLSRARDGGWRVARILPGESSDSRARSPLAAQGPASARGRCSPCRRPPGATRWPARPAAGRRRRHHRWS